MVSVVSVVERVTTAPPVGAALVRFTVAVEGEPPTTDVGLTVSEETLWAWAEPGKRSAISTVKSNTTSRLGPDGERGARRGWRLRWLANDIDLT